MVARSNCCVTLLPRRTSTAVGVTASERFCHTSVHQATSATGTSAISREISRRWFSPPSERGSSCGSAFTQVRTMKNASTTRRISRGRSGALYTLVIGAA
ncbi:MAG TPA: hypothetical protein DHV14_02280 [Micrococcales bacterium]|nr:hypothetical protein [Micrococcales bacterium]